IRQNFFLIALDFLKKRDRFLRVFGSIKWNSRLMLRPAVLIRVLSFFLLQLRRITQDISCNFYRRLSCKNISFIAVFHDMRQISNVIEMRMSNENISDRADGDRKGI